MENYSNSSSHFKKVLICLKTKGTLPTSVIAKELSITTEGARLLLLKMAEEGLINSSFQSKGVGRPSQVWSLTETANTQFPDAHADLSVQLIDTIVSEINDDALEVIIKSREKSIYRKYAQELDLLPDLEQKVARFAEMRSEDGYLAEWTKEEDGTYLLIENHCPISAAAKKCNSFCLSELNTLRDLFGDTVEITRTHYIINGDRRCVYRIQRTAPQPIE